MSQGKLDMRYEKDGVTVELECPLELLVAERKGAPDVLTPLCGLSMEIEHEAPQIQFHCQYRGSRVLEVAGNRYYGCGKRFSQQMATQASQLTMASYTQGEHAGEGRIK